MFRKHKAVKNTEIAVRDMSKMFSVDREVGKASEKEDLKSDQCLQGLVGFVKI